MRNPPLPERPDGAINSLDRGLRLLQLLRDYGNLRVMDAATHLNVSRSSAHRLLQTLVYRGFAVQNESHVYSPGPSLDAAPTRLAWAKTMRALCQPHLEVLSRRSGASANLMIRVKTEVRFLGTVRADTAFATSYRDGVVMPACYASGGKALLAELRAEEVRELYAATTSSAPASARTDVDALLTELDSIRQRGFAINFQQTERGVAAVGVVVRHHSAPIAAISVSTRADRFADLVERTLVPLVLDAQVQIERDLEIVGLGSGPPTTPER